MIANRKDGLYRQELRGSGQGENPTSVRKMIDEIYSDLKTAVGPERYPVTPGRMILSGCPATFWLWSA